MEGKENENEDEDERKSTALFLLVFFILSLCTLVLGIVCVGNVRSTVVKMHEYAWIAAVCVSISIICALSVWAVLARKEVLKKSLLSVYAFLIFALLTWLILQKTGFFEVIRSADSLRQYLEKTGAWMPTLYVVLQFLQVIVLPIPSVVSTAAGVALFGAFRATVYSLIGILLGSFIAFIIGRKLGYRAVSWLVGEETLKKWQKKLKGKDNLFLTLAFVLPLFPDDALCLLAGLSTMSTGYFVAVIFLSRVLGIAATCYLVDFIPFNTWWGIALWGAFLIGIIVIFVLVYKNLDKLQALLKKKKKK